MRVYLVGEKTGVNAKGEYDPVTGAVTVLKGSLLSTTIAHTETFRGSKSIEKRREGVLKKNVLQKDVSFKSASSAANFVTGNSTNGLIAWKDINGKKIKDIISEIEV